MSSRLQTFPPHVHLTKPKSVDQAAALSLIQSYIEASTTTPYLHPDCTFNESGPIHSNVTMGGIVLHQLRRVEKGLRGEVLRPEEDMGGLDTTSYPVVSLKQNGAELPPGDDTELDARITAMRGDAGATHREKEAEDMPMLDDVPLKNYQEQMRHQGQGIFEGEIGDRTNVVGALRVNTPGQGKKRRHDEMNGDTSVYDKEARKSAKKARNKAMQLEKQNAGKHTAERDESMELDETRELHDEPGPSSDFLPNKISETVVAPPASTADGAEEYDAKERLGARKKRRKEKNRKSDVDMESSTAPPEPESQSKTTSTNGITVSETPLEKKSSKNNRNRDKQRHSDSMIPQGRTPATNGIHRSRIVSPDSPTPRTNGTTSIPETPQTTKKRKHDKSSAVPNDAIHPPNETLIKDSQVTVPESPATNHKLSNGVKHHDEDQEKRDERAERKRIRKAEKAEKRRKKEAKRGQSQSP